MEIALGKMVIDQKLRLSLAEMPRLSLFSLWCFLVLLCWPIAVIAPFFVRMFPLHSPKK